MSTYQGYDVLELNYNRDGDIAEAVTRKMQLLDNLTGEKQAAEHAPAPNPTRAFKWTAFGRAEIAAMRTFLEARVGRAVPFWFPSLQWDLKLASDLANTDTIAEIVWVRYTQQMFGTTGGRRHLAFFALGDQTPSMDYYMVTDANDPADEVTESLTISPGAARDYPAASTVISFLKLCRLENDQVEIVYPVVGIAEALIEVREIPMEAPVS